MPTLSHILVLRRAVLGELTLALDTLGGYLDPEGDLGLFTRTPHPQVNGARFWKEAKLEPFGSSTHPTYKATYRGRTYFLKGVNNQEFHEQLAAREIAVKMGAGKNTLHMQGMEHTKEGGAHDWLLSAMKPAKTHMPMAALKDMPDKTPAEALKFVYSKVSKEARTNVALHEYLTGQTGKHAGNYLWEHTDKTGHFTSPDSGLVSVDHAMGHYSHVPTSPLSAFGMEGDHALPKKALQKIAKNADAIKAIAEKHGLSDVQKKALSDRLDTIKKVSEKDNPTYKDLKDVAGAHGLIQPFKNAKPATIAKPKPAPKPKAPAAATAKLPHNAKPTEPEPAKEPEPKTEPKAEPKAEATAKTEPEPKQEPKTEPVSTKEPEAKQEPEPTPAKTPKAKKQPPEPSADTAKFSTKAITAQEIKDLTDKADKAMVDQGAYAEDHAAAAVAKRLENNPAWTRDAQIAMCMAHDPYSSASYISGLSDEALSQKAVWSMIKTWNGSSTGSKLATAQQMAAQDEFKLQDLYDGWAKSSSGTDLYSQHGPALRAAVREMHNETQDKLKAAGLEYVFVGRGIKAYSGQGDFFPHDGKPHKIDTRLQPLSSFGVGAEAIHTFATGKDLHCFMGGMVHRSRILSFSSTGMGTGYENEAVVLGGHDRIPGVGWGESYDYATHKYKGSKQIHSKTHGDITYLSQNQIWDLLSEASQPSATKWP